MAFVIFLPANSLVKIACNKIQVLNTDPQHKKVRMYSLFLFLNPVKTSDLSNVAQAVKTLGISGLCFLEFLTSHSQKIFSNF